MASILTLGSAAAFSGCLESSTVGDETVIEDQTTAEIDDESSTTAVAEAPLSGDTSRSDYVKSVALNQGLWGSWQTTRYCPAGSRAVGYRMRVEQGQGDGDDTALNAVELRCMDDAGELYTASSHDGLFGSWYDFSFCPKGSVIVGGAIRFESNRGSGDDTGANNVRVRCSDGTDVQAPGGMGYGSWNGNVACDAGTSVCGIKVRFEGNQGGGDDTALNAVEFACCTDNTRKTRLAISEYQDDYIRSRTFSPDTGAARAPLIFVEGFDIDGTMNLDKINQEMPDYMIDNLTRRGYSVTIVDLRRNWDGIATNARRVGDLANRIWAASTKEKPMKFVGASMGGLIVATAAAMRGYWADLGEANPNWSFVIDHVSTVDSPHAGAYVPQAIYNIASRFQSHRDSAKSIYNALSSVAASQMMLVPFNSGLQGTRDSWQTYYSKVKLALRKSGLMVVGLANGSWTGAQQYTNWTSGSQNIGWEYRSTAADFDVWAYTQPTPGGTVARVKADFFAVGADEDKSYPSLTGNWPIVENSSGGSLNLWRQLANALGNTNGPVFDNVSFVPTWSAAGISLDDFLALPKAEQDNMTTLETNRGPIAHSRLSPLTKTVAINGSWNSTHTSLTFSTALERELFDAFEYAWTDWINRDNEWGNGDGEHRGLMTGIPCTQPFAVQCRRAIDGVDSTLTGEIVRCNLDGAECLNSKQPDGWCDDYEVRFACPAPTNVVIKDHVPVI
jgi:pimeloyl-ACP methyl ester carboxylesterase